MTFSHKLYDATNGRFQLSTDGYGPYRTAIPSVFGQRLDFAQLVKVYGLSEEPNRRYSPPHVIAIHATPCTGTPDMDRVCTSHVERSNLSNGHDDASPDQIDECFQQEMGKS